MRSAPPELSSRELLRYARHLTLPEVGVEGQRRLKAARVLLIGAGGRVDPAGLYLACAGGGTLGLVEFDRVDATNLQRQILHGTAAIGQPKLDSARARLADLNPHVSVVPFAERLASANALEIVRQFDIVVDGSDNFPTRYLANDACVLTGRPLVSGSILRFDGQLSVFDAERGPCYRCLFSEPPPPEQVPSCAEGGVLGVLPGIIGSLQALETVKLILGVGESLVGRLLVFDGLRLRFRELRLKKDPTCPVCGPEPTVTGLIDYEAFCGVGAPEPKEAEIEPRSLLAELSGDPAPVLLDVREPWEHELVHIGGARLIPLAELPARLAELPGHAEIVAYCHKGVRSLRARELLRGAGFGRVRSLAGGIDRWAAELEPEMTRY
jgi:adenylyltransferase/sulfurtransferase